MCGKVTWTQGEKREGQRNDEGAEQHQVGDLRGDKVAGVSEGQRQQGGDKTADDDTWGHVYGARGTYSSKVTGHTEHGSQGEQVSRLGPGNGTAHGHHDPCQGPADGDPRACRHHFAEKHTAHQRRHEGCAPQQDQNIGDSRVGDG